MHYKNIVGREKEIKILEECRCSDKSEFVALFGRRRVGKTFLIQEVFGKDILLRVTGLYKKPKSRQLASFSVALKEAFGNISTERLKNWQEAFAVLRENMQLLPKTPNRKKIIFIDELPWLNTSKSGLMTELEYFWNNYAAWEHDVILIVCGSATSWIVDKIINNRGGLHNRLTRRIHLYPFTLKETETFLKKKGLHWSRYQITECYMMMGGIPYYLDNIPLGVSTPAEAIDEMFFTSGGVLRDEYENLFVSLFQHAEPYEAIIKALSDKPSGLSRDNLLEAAGIVMNGKASQYIKSLIACGFISEQHMYGKKKQHSRYRLIDPFVIFYLNFIDREIPLGGNYWRTMQDSPMKNNWEGHAFETVCLLHVNQIRESLNFGAVTCVQSAWRANATEEYDGAEVDMVIERRDQVINLFEMKFSIDEYSISEAYEKSLRNKIRAFRLSTGTRKSVQLVMVTTYGLRQNIHSGIVSSQVTLDGLFG